MLLAVLLVATAALPASAALPLRRKACGDVVMSSFRLRNNLTNCHEGLVIGAPGVVIDLNGKTISGRIFSTSAMPAGGSSSGIRVDPLMNGAVIKNGTIRYFVNSGILVLGAHRVTIRNVDILTNGYGVRLQGGRRHKLLDNVISGNGGATSGGGVLATADLSELLDNRVVNNGAVDGGIRLEGNNNRIMGNRFGGNGSFGLSIIGDRNYITNNRALENAAAGMLTIGEYNALEANVAVGNSSHGYDLRGLGNTLTRNSARLNDGHGIVVAGSETVVTRNVVCGNALRPQIDVEDGNTVRNNDVSRDC